MLLVAGKPVVAFLQIESGAEGRTRSRVSTARATVESPTDASDFRFEDAADFRFEEPVDFRFDDADLRFVDADFRFVDADFRFVDADLRFVDADLRFDDADFRFVEADFRFEDEADFRFDAVPLLDAVLRLAEPPLRVVFRFEPDFVVDFERDFPPAVFERELDAFRDEARLPELFDLRELVRERPLEIVRRPPPRELDPDPSEPLSPPPSPSSDSSSEPISFLATPTAAGIATPSAVPATTFCVVERPSSSSFDMITSRTPSPQRRTRYLASLNASMNFGTIRSRRISGP